MNDNNVDPVLRAAVDKHYMLVASIPQVAVTVWLGGNTKKMTSRWTLRIEVALLLASLSSVPVNGLFHANTIVFLLPAYSEECFFIPTKHVQEVIDIDYNVSWNDLV